MERWGTTARGAVSLTVCGAEPERLLNACARAGILVWDSRSVDPVTLRLRVYRRDRVRMEGLCAKLLLEVAVTGERGLPGLFARLKGRYGFWAGLVCSTCAVVLLSQFLLTVEVRGNESVPTAVILSELRRQGVRPGAYGPGLDETLIAQRALVELEDLSWLAVNLHGTRAEVLVREKVPKPPLENARRPADVVAEADGILLHVEPWSGKALVAEGDTVVAGDVLLSGWVPIDPPEYSGVDTLGHYTVRAEGRIEARTWRTLTAVIPAQVEVQQPTGRERKRLSAVIFGKRLNFYRNSGISFAEYDKITRSYPLTLPGGVRLPLSLWVETYRETERLSANADPEQVRALLEAGLRGRLREFIGEGEVLHSQVSAVERDGVWTLRLLAECREEIGKTVEWPPEKGEVES